MPRKALVLVTTILLVTGCLRIANAAPSGTIGAPSGTIADNVLQTSGTYSTEQVSISFTNSAGSGDLNDVASTIQYIALAAANVNPSRVSIDADATWEIRPGASGSVTATLQEEYYSPYSTSQKVELYTWYLGKPDGASNLEEYTSSGQFASDLRILRPTETIKLTITVRCKGIEGDSRLFFFFRATEDHFSGSYPTSLGQVSDKANLYYSQIPRGGDTKYWLPLHNSYDPWDSDLQSGHNFGQHSWTRGKTTNAFAKSNKLVHQKPGEDPPSSVYSFHICGTKFQDSNRNGVFDIETEQGINDVLVTLLGPDKTTRAELYPAYVGKFSYPPQETNPLKTGENNLIGAYCFNLLNIALGTYTFYVRIEESASKLTTSQIIGPIILVASEQGPRDSINHHFGNGRRVSVGGLALSVNMAAILSSYLAPMALGIIVVAMLATTRRKH